MRTVLGFCMFFLILCGIEIFTGRLLRPLLRCRTGRLVVVIPHVPVMVPLPHGAGGAVAPDAFPQP